MNISLNILSLWSLFSLLAGQLLNLSFLNTNFLPLAFGTFLIPFSGCVLRHQNSCYYGNVHSFLLRWDLCWGAARGQQTWSLMVTFPGTFMVLMDFYIFYSSFTSRVQIKVLFLKLSILKTISGLSGVIVPWHSSCFPVYRFKFLSCSFTCYWGDLLLCTIKDSTKSKQCQVAISEM